MECVIRLARVKMPSKDEQPWNRNTQNSFLVIHTLMDWFYVLICCGNGLEHMLELPFDKWVRNYTHALYCTIFLWVEITKKKLFFFLECLYKEYGVELTRIIWRIDIGNKVMLKHFYIFHVEWRFGVSFVLCVKYPYYQQKRGVLTDYNVTNAKTLEHEIST